ncbi:zinc transport protein, putative [Theileria equi strain WA]|uniref:Zinc transport protein, putative n=1 Tax=Theileria equi strain WA TaxID=1537102 RepID=L1LCJ6_THEEQ|nr:zinc transport protein, putative [Theileria equi strain WA]EKX73162.1 zinc transport protein, putative [Theileria equi strain WA]|eukprot:XP_004832614.1 zinc transport protein, putative [Theileria equi strain WA]
MGVSFLHILPEAAEKCERAKIAVGGGDHPVNLSYLLLLVSFAFMLLIERVVSAGRDPCTASFNDCSTSSKCCALTTHPPHAEEAPSNAQIVNIIVRGGEHEKLRFRHKHTDFLAKIKNIICPLCECNGLCITLALFTHSVFEGMVIGLEKENHSKVWLITLGVVLHKWTTGMALSSFIANETTFVKTIMIGIFCLGSPLGVLIGGLTPENETASAILDSIAVGTLIYVGFEIIVHELFCDIQCRNTALGKWACVVTGIAFILGMMVLESHFFPHTHGHHHGHHCLNECYEAISKCPQVKECSDLMSKCGKALKRCTEGHGGGDAHCHCSDSHH